MSNLERKYYKQMEERLVRIYVGEDLEYLANKIETNIFNKYVEVKELIGINDGKIYKHKYCDVSIGKDINNTIIRFNKEECNKVKDSIIRVFYGMLDKIMEIEVKYNSTFDYYYVEIDVDYLVRYYYDNVISKESEAM